MALSRATIVEAAYAMLCQHGLAGLSMRRLAQDLGVQAGALYYHVESKQDLLAAVAERILGDSAPVISATDPGQKAEISERRYYQYVTAPTSSPSYMPSDPSRSYLSENSNGSSASSSPYSKLDGQPEPLSTTSSGSSQMNRTMRSSCVLGSLATSLPMRNHVMRSALEWTPSSKDLPR